MNLIKTFNIRLLVFIISVRFKWVVSSFFEGAALPAAPIIFNKIKGIYFVSTFRMAYFITGFADYKRVVLEYVLRAAVACFSGLSADIHQMSG